MTTTTAPPPPPPTNTATITTNTSATPPDQTATAKPSGKSLKAYEQELRTKKSAPYHKRFTPVDLEDIDLDLNDLIAYDDYDPDREDGEHYDPFDSDTDTDTDEEDNANIDNDDEKDINNDEDYTYTPEEWGQRTTNTMTYETNQPNLSTNAYNINTDIPFKNYIARCLLTCHNQELLAAMHPFVLEVVDHFHQGNLPHIDWNNSTRLQPDPAGNVGGISSPEYTGLSDHLHVYYILGTAPAD
jgi:hypothetical protein